MSFWILYTILYSELSRFFILINKNFYQQSKSDIIF